MFLKYWFLIYLAHLKINKWKDLFFLGIPPGIATCYQQITDLKKKKAKKSLRMLDMKKMAYVLKPVSIQNATGRTGYLRLHEPWSMFFSAKDHALFWKESLCDLDFKLANPGGFCKDVEPWMSYTAI